MGVADKEKPKSKTQRAKDVVEIAQQVASGNSALTSALLLHGLPLLAHVLPHTPQLLARFLLMLTERDKKRRDDEATGRDGDDDDVAPA